MAVRVEIFLALVAAVAAATKPNFLIILVDDLGQRIQPSQPCSQDARHLVLC